MIMSNNKINEMKTEHKRTENFQKEGRKEQNRT